MLEKTDQFRVELAWRGFRNILVWTWWSVSQSLIIIVRLSVDFKSTIEIYFITNHPNSLKHLQTTLACYLQTCQKF